MSTKSKLSMAEALCPIEKRVKVSTKRHATLKKEAAKRKISMKELAEEKFKIADKR